MTYLIHRTIILQKGAKPIVSHQPIAKNDLKAYRAELNASVQGDSSVQFIYETIPDSITKNLEDNAITVKTTKTRPSGSEL